LDDGGGGRDKGWGGWGKFIGVGGGSGKGKKGFPEKRLLKGGENVNEKDANKGRGGRSMGQERPAKKNQDVTCEK